MSCGLFAATDALICGAALPPGLNTSLTASSVRLAVNLAVLLVAAAPFGGIRTLVADAHPTLWIIGLLDAAGVTCAYASVKLAGLGESSFLMASDGLIVLVLAPVVWGQRPAIRHGLALLGSATGLYLLLGPGSGGSSGASLLGKALALAAALFMAGGNLVLARSGRRHHPMSVAFYFCTVGLIGHVVAFGFTTVRWPQSPRTWAMLAAAGFAASLANLSQIQAYRVAPAALNGLLGNLSPVFKALLATLLFGRMLGVKEWTGASLILISSLTVSFLFRDSGSFSWPTLVANHGGAARSAPTADEPS
jgi:drug/metabolite transporter (DMT)-like permease